MTPVRLKYWHQDDLWNGRYTITDFFEALEFIAAEEARKLQVQAALRGVEVE